MTTPAMLVLLCEHVAYGVSEEMELSTNAAYNAACDSTNTCEHRYNQHVCQMLTPVVATDG